jgi:hypothetical protein
MTAVNKQDSNMTGLRIAEETSIGVLPGTPVWTPHEPNSYADFGGEVSMVARDTINDSRQKDKGVVTDLDAKFGFNEDLTQTNVQDKMQGFFYADFRRKAEVTAITAIDGTGETYAKAAGLNVFQAGSLVFAAGFTAAANNGLKRVTTAVAALLTVAEDLTEDASPVATATLVEVGFQGTAGDLDVDVSGTLPVIASTSLDFTTLGLIPGETIFIGGDGALLGFTNAANNGVKRIRSISANALTLDKSGSSMVTETSTSETVQIFFGRVLKNELSGSIVRRSYQAERTLGAPDSALPAEIQSEYIVGAVPSEFALNIAQADKITVDLSYMAIGNEQRTGAVGVKSGTRPALTSADAFNTSTDFSRIKLSTVSSTDEAPTALFAFIQDMTISLNNNLTVNKAVGSIGGFDVTAGAFGISGSVTGYFSDIAAISAVRNNTDITLDFFMVKNNAGISVDIPLISLGDGKAAVEKDAPITIPVSMEAARARSIDAAMDYTMMIVFFDYLPLAAE